MKKSPFQGKDLKDVIAKNKIGKISFREWKNYSKEAKKCLKKMLRKDPNKRISLEDIKQCDWVQFHKEHKSKNLISTITSSIRTNHFKIRHIFSDKSFENSREEKSPPLQNRSIKNISNSSISSFLKEESAKFKSPTTVLQFSFLENYSVNI